MRNYLHATMRLLARGTLRDTLTKYYISSVFKQEFKIDLIWTPCFGFGLS